ncbi:3-mercaptopyruvate sulfurtransferase [Paracoccus aerodenitrificans]|uniref:3-mercaptopyruvate sulfurtransferase n=1 Tax=Paracoccus aerodenitrificans TaxID=3017781 RepID=UPI0022F10187|nr:3-mercaptopyruvate sulfurtransferase [Paracoccus aerodenitrificans]WBU62833.1 3-mercaptopyruvate sulfurtransferase [Paracoccus aerodenitrificans]
MTDDLNTLVSTAWLAAHLNDPDLHVLDASWHMPAEDRDAQAEFRARHIPGAQFFDIDRICDPDSDLPHMAASENLFLAEVKALGIGDGDKVIVYDNAATHSAARVWWNFRLMGKSRVAVLDGGLAKWLAEDRPVEAGIGAVTERPLTARRDCRQVVDAAQMREASESGSHEIIDARSAERFQGKAPEPRKGLASGHIPGSRNLPFGQLYNGDGTMKRVDDLRAAFDRAGVDLSRPVITSCGSGISAASLSLALEILGHRNHALYDGSWTEWGALPNAKIATGD